jgi:ascorbate-specific PTS system EIIC-type component UlaA
MLAPVRFKNCEAQNFNIEIVATSRYKKLKAIRISGRKICQERTFMSSSILATRAWMLLTISFKGDIVGYFPSSHANLHSTTHKQINKIQKEHSQATVPSNSTSYSSFSWKAKCTVKYVKATQRGPYRKICFTRSASVSV